MNLADYCPVFFLCLQSLVIKIAGLTRYSKEPPLSSKPEFRLTKWYADCVAENGDTVVLYHGVARWHGIAVHYSNLLRLFPSGRPCAGYSLRKCAPPRVLGGVMEWESHALKAKGSWERIDAPFHTIVYESEAGAVEWHCLQPRSRAAVQLGDGTSIHGLGYAERLEMSLPPWKMPIRELRWGRFLSKTDSLVWMDWRGPYSKQIILHNGETQGEAEVGARKISIGEEMLLKLADGDVLRSGRLGTTALAMIPGVDKVLPGRILKVEECKWRGRAELRRRNSISTGWAIHEVVRWPE